VVTPRPVEVEIDVRPGSSRNLIFVDSRGNVPVAILGSHALDVTGIDLSSVRFGPEAASAVRGQGHFRDTNGDGLTDLVLYFAVRESGIRAGDTEASLTGMTYGGERFQGNDHILAIGAKVHPAMHK
jgi:hypothetical protein